jgi:hypothetical protein
MEQKGTSESKGSEALQVFLTRLDNVKYLARGISRGTEQLHGPIGAANRVTGETADALRTLRKNSPTFSLELAHISSNFSALKEYIDEIGAIILGNVQVYPVLFDWTFVITVTFAEAYLETGLLLLTTVYPAWMNTKETVKVSGADVLEIEAQFDIEKRWQELLALLRKRWVKQFLNESPEKWIARLEKFGAPKYPADMAAKMTTIWNRRHVIVHARSVAQSDQLAESMATLAQIMSQFGDAIGVICGFVKATDAFVVGVLKTQNPS